MSKTIDVTIVEHDDSVSIFYDGVWKLTLGCHEVHVGFVYDIMLKWVTNISKGKIAPSPVWHMILGGLVTWYSDEPGESKTRDDDSEVEEE